VTVPTVDRGLFDSARCSIDVRLGELLQKLARVGRQGLDVAPLALGVDRVEGER
jgi:hypothetical protein